MHNNQNSVLGKDIFADTDAKALTNYIAKIKEQPSSSISEDPQILRNYLDKKSKAIRSQLTPYQEELIDKANKYGISLALNLDEDISKYDFDTLADDISRWEELLEKATNLGIDWQSSNYDPIGLDQAIDDHNARSWREYKSLHSDFLATDGI